MLIARICHFSPRLACLATLLVGWAAFAMAQEVTSDTLSPAELKPTSSTEQIIKYTQAQKLSEHWLKQVELFKQQNQHDAPGKVVMVGDSITEGFPVNEFYPDGSVVTRGVAGDTLDGLLRRMDESIFALKPKHIFVLIGINDMYVYPKYTQNEYLNLYELLYRSIHERAPQARVHIQSVLPVGDDFWEHAAAIKTMNRIQRGLAKKYGYDYMDLHKIFAAPNGHMNMALSTDGVHPNRAGQEAWKKEIDRHLKD
jgi:lysophospholipase L1-like esterase